MKLFSSPPLSCAISYFGGKKKKGEERKDNEKDVLSSSVEAETGDQHGVSAVLCLPSLFQTAVCVSGLSVHLSPHRLGGWQSPVPPEGLCCASSVTEAPRRRGKANMLQQAGKL